MVPQFRTGRGSEIFDAWMIYQWYCISATSDTNVSSDTSATNDTSDTSATNDTGATDASAISDTSNTIVLLGVRTQWCNDDVF